MLEFYLVACTIIVLCFIAVGIAYGCISHNGTIVTFGFFCAIAFIIAFIETIKECHEPTAMDVYQGKTTLKVTYVDNVPVDSVVIYKKK